jgi:single-strand DNA-binding protein
MLNTVVLIGRLTRDPELRYTSQGTAVTNFGIAVDRGYKTQGDQQTADFFNIVCWNRLAEIVAQYMVKGRLVAVQGRLQSRTVDRDGQRRTYVEVVASTVRFLERPTQSNFDEGHHSDFATSEPPAGYGQFQPNPQQKKQQPSGAAPEQKHYKEMNFEVEDDDLPF